MIEFIKNLLATQGLSEEMTLSISNAVMAVIILLISTLIYLIAKKVLLRVLGTIITKSKTKLGDALLRNKVFERIIYIIPAFIIHASAPVFPAYQVWIQRIAFCYMVFVFLLALNKLFDAIDDIYRSYEVSRARPIKGYLQVLKIASYIIGIIVIIAVRGNT